MLLSRALLAGRLILGAVFLYAAYTKLIQSRLLFAMAIDSYQLLPDWAVFIIARCLPWFELLLGLLLVAGFGLRYVAAAASVLLAVFLGVMIRSYMKGLGIDCGCFGVGEALGVRTLIRDGFLTLLSVVLAVLSFRAPRSPIPSPQPH
jgi:uncharacterized membrane protein YphA (DoxX/SURF4 family)